MSTVIPRGRNRHAARWQSRCEYARQYAEVSAVNAACSRMRVEVARRVRAVRNQCGRKAAQRWRIRTRQAECARCACKTSRQQARRYVQVATRRQVVCGENAVVCVSGSVGADISAGGMPRGAGAQVRSAAVKRNRRICRWCACAAVRAKAAQVNGEKVNLVGRTCVLSQAVRGRWQNRQVARENSVLIRCKIR